VRTGHTKSYHRSFLHQEEKSDDAMYLAEHKTLIEAKGQSYVLKGRRAIGNLKKPGGKKNEAEGVLGICREDSFGKEIESEAKKA